jgi:hypothetical protein
MNAPLNKIAQRRWFASRVVAIDLNVRFRPALMSAKGGGFERSFAGGVQIPPWA